MSSLNKIRILENDEQKKTNPNSNEAFELGFVDSLRKHLSKCFLFVLPASELVQIDRLGDENFS